MPEIGIADKETLDKIDTNVGAKTDAASSTGSLHAKVKTANDRIGTANPSSGGTDTLFKYDRKIFDRLDEEYEPFSFAKNVSIPTSWTAVKNVTGRSGFLFSAGVLSHSRDCTFYIRITIDGAVVFYGRTSSSSTTDDRSPTGIIYTPAELHRQDYAYYHYYDSDLRITTHVLWQCGTVSAVLSNIISDPTFPSASLQGPNAVLLSAAPIRFNSSLKIEHHVSGSTSRTANIIHTGVLVKQ
jgi:hypothetical protein